MGRHAIPTIGSRTVTEFHIPPSDSMCVKCVNPLPGSIGSRFDYPALTCRVFLFRRFAAGLFQFCRSVNCLSAESGC